MATVKLQNGNVILKDGKVSCSCCVEPECCMYPAQALADGDYSADDLPDEVGYGCTREGSEILSKNGRQYEAVIFGENYIYTSDGNPNPPPDSPTPTPGFWTLYKEIYFTVYDEFYYIPIQTETPGDCLIQFGLDECGFYDQFADTYTVSGPISGTVTRESICVWRGTNLRLTNYGYQWKINGNDKSGNQNTPVGSYAGGYTVS